LDINRNGTYEANELIINNLTNQGFNTADLDGSNEAPIGHADWRGGIPLVAGQRYDMRLEHYDQTGGSGLRLFWNSEFTPTPTIIQLGSTLTAPPDTTGPRVTRVVVDGKLPAGMTYTPNGHIAIVFSEDIANTLQPEDMLIFGNGGAYSGGALTVHGYDPATNTAVVTFTDVQAGLPDGNWQVIIYDSTVTDAAGNPLDGDNDANTPAGQFTGDIYAWQADTQHDVNGNPLTDRKVDFIDFQILEKNFGRTNASHSEGDFDHDGDVDNADFQILQSRFGTGQAAPAAPVASSPAPAPAPVTAAPAPVKRPAPVKKAAPAPKAKPVVVAPVKAAPAKFATKRIAGAKALLA